MSKTYYSVLYRAWGSDKARTAWFNDKEEAYKFADHDYRDTPVVHRVSRPEKIAECEEMVNQTAFDLSNY